MKKVLITSLLLVRLISGTAQTKETKPIADETTIKVSGEKNIAVKCSNEKITAMLLKKFENIIVRYNVNYKKDRMGRYAEYTIYFSKENENVITNFLKSL